MIPSWNQQPYPAYGCSGDPRGGGAGISPARRAAAALIRAGTADLTSSAERGRTRSEPGNQKDVTGSTRAKLRCWLRALKGGDPASAVLRRVRGSRTVSIRRRGT